jgi:hypothetical protein
MLSRNLTRIAAVALVGACTGCPGGLDDPGRFSVEGPIGACPDIPQTVLVSTCATATCHSAATKIQGLDLESPGVTSRLVGVPATEGAGLLIDPSDPRSSVLYTKLTATPPFGVRMPFNEPPLDDATIACVLQWVTVQVDGGAGEGGAAGTDARVGDDEAAAGESDGSSSGEASLGEDGGASGEAAVPTVDAGSEPDAHVTHPRDAAPEASSSDDAGTPFDDAD